MAPDVAEDLARGGLDEDGVPALAGHDGGGAGLCPQSPEENIIGGIQSIEPGAKALAQSHEHVFRYEV